MCYKVLVSCEYCACIPHQTCVVMYIDRSEGCLKVPDISGCVERMTQSRRLEMLVLATLCLKMLRAHPG